MPFIANTIAAPPFKEEENGKKGIVIPKEGEGRKPCALATLRVSKKNNQQKCGKRGGLGHNLHICTNKAPTFKVIYTFVYSYMLRSLLVVI